MAAVYILYSRKLDKYYTGSCLDLSVRLSKHLERFYPSAFTAKSDDWELFFAIDDLSSSQARMIERHIKKMKSKVYIQNMAKYPDIIKRLKQKYA